MGAYQENRQGGIEYCESFEKDGKPNFEGSRFFWVRIAGPSPREENGSPPPDDNENFYGKALALAENVIPSMDEIFISRSGKELGLEVIGDKEKNLAGVVWRNRNGDFCLVLMTNGRDIIAIDPCFIPTGRSGRGLSIEITDYRKGIEDYYWEQPWTIDCQRLVAASVPGRLITTGIMVEGMQKILERKVNRSSLKNRRAYF